MRVVAGTDGPLLRTRTVEWQRLWGPVQAFVLVQPFAVPWPGAEGLWVTAIASRADLAGQEVEALLAADPVQVVESIRRGVALIGLSWDVLVEDPVRMGDQIRAWVGCAPELDVVPPDAVWRTRQWALGAPLTRVASALLALGYEPDAPADRGVVEAMLS